MLSAQDQAYWSAAIPRILAEQQGALTALGTQTPEQVKRDQCETVEFYPWLKGLCDRVLKRHRSLWAANYNLWVKNALYFLSLQNLKGNGTSFGYKITFKDHRFYPYNIFRPNAEETIAAYFGAHPVVKWMAFEMEERRSLHIMREIEALDQYFDFQYFTEEMKMRTLMDGLICGNRHFEVWYDENSEDGIGWEQQYHDVAYPEKITAHCYGCGAQSEADQSTQTCPVCGSSSIKLTKEEGSQYRIPGEQTLKRMGDVVMKDWSPLQMRYDLDTGAENSPWLYLEEDAPREELEYQYDERIADAARTETWATDENMHPMRAIRRAEAERSATGSMAAAGEFESILKQRFLFEKCMFHFVKLSQPEKLPSGTTVPANVRLSEFFENGVDCLTYPGGSKFFAVEDRSHKKRFRHGKHMIAPGWQVGVGNRDGARYNFQENVLRSGMYRYLQKTLQPSVVASQQLFPKRDFWNLVDNVIHFSSTQMSGRPLADHVMPLAPPPLNAQLHDMIERLKLESRESFKAYTSESDGFDRSNPTAHAAELSQQRRNLAHGMNMVLFAGTIKEVKILRMEVAQENYDGLRLIGQRDEVTAQWRSKQLKAEDIQCGFLVYVVTDSATPDYPQQKRQKFADAIMLAGELGKLGMLNPGSLQQVNQMCGVDLTFSNQFQHIELCERAFQTMKEMDTRTNGQTPAEMLVSAMPIKQNAPDHLLHREWWARLLGSLEAQTFSPELERAINLRIEQYDLFAAANLQRIQMLAPAPPQNPQEEQAKQKPPAQKQAGAK